MINYQKIEKLQHDWQVKWREMLGMSIEEMPEDISCDFELHFDIWTLSDEKLKESFSLFPGGLKMLQRASILRSISPEKTSPDDSVLLGHIDKINRKIESVLSKAQLQSAISFNDKKKESTGRAVYRENAAKIADYFSEACFLTLPLDDDLKFLLEQQHGLEGYAAYEFLREPFYRIANNTVLANYVFWAALYEEIGEDPFDSVLELHKFGALAGWNNTKKEMFVFVSS